MFHERPQLPIGSEACSPPAIRIPTRAIRSQRLRPNDLDSNEPNYRCCVTFRLFTAKPLRSRSPFRGRITDQFEHIFHGASSALFAATRQWHRAYSRDSRPTRCSPFWKSPLTEGGCGNSLAMPTSHRRILVGHLDMPRQCRQSVLVPNRPRHNPSPTEP
jgi:hypothetical protein